MHVFFPLSQIAMLDKRAIQQLVQLLVSFLTFLFKFFRSADCQFMMRFFIYSFDGLVHDLIGK